MNPMLLSVPGEYIFFPREPRDVHQLFQHSTDQLLHVFTEIGHTVTDMLKIAAFFIQRGSCWFVTKKIIAMLTPMLSMFLTNIENSADKLINMFNPWRIQIFSKDGVPILRRGCQF